MLKSAQSLRQSKHPECHLCYAKRKVQIAAANSRAGVGKRTKHGHTRKGKPTREYCSWKAMLQRCLDKGSKDYPNWGGRGIFVCDRWLGDRGYQNFLEDMNRRPAGTTLGRLDNDGPYAPWNCAWQTPKEQNSNTRRTKKKPAPATCEQYVRAQQQQSDLAVAVQ